MNETLARRGRWGSTTADCAASDAVTACQWLTCNRSRRPASERIKDQIQLDATEEDETDSWRRESTKKKVLQRSRTKITGSMVARAITVTGKAFRASPAALVRRTPDSFIWTIWC